MNSKYLTLLILALLWANTATAQWVLQYTARDTMGGYTNSYKDYTNLIIKADDEIIKEYPTLSGDHNYGNQSLDITEYVTNGKSQITFELTGYRGALLLYDIDILHDGKPARFTPWIINKSTDKVRAYNYSDSRIMMVLGEDLTGINQITFKTQPLKIEPELEIRQSDLKFNKKIYTIQEKEQVTVNVTIRNIGARREDAAKIQLLINDNKIFESETIQLNPREEKTITIPYRVDFENRKHVKIQAIAIPSDSQAEGKHENNQATKYILKRPSMYFTDISQTPAIQYSNQYPYTTWISSLKSNVETCMGYDYSNTKLQETTKSNCLIQMALLYHLTNDEKIAEKTVEGLTYIGAGSWSWLDRTKDGNAKIGSLDKGTNENYGSSRVIGATWGKLLTQYSQAYNWIHNYAVQQDTHKNSKSTQLIRDNLAHLTLDTYLLLKEVYSYGDVGTGVSSHAFGDYGTGRIAIEGPFGIAALGLLDYDGKYQDIDGSPHEWINFVEKDLILESQTGSKIPHLDQHMSIEGFYEEGGGYRDYYEPALSSFIAIYNEVLGVNLAKNHPIIDGVMKDIPLTATPGGRYPNYAVSYGGVWDNLYDSLSIYPKGSQERKLINNYIKKSLLTDKGYRRMAGDYGAYHKLLVYDITEPSALPSEPTFFSPNGTINILRSGWDQKAIYSFVKAPNEPTMSGHAPLEFHQLSFDLWAKGAYLVVDAGDERFLGPYDGHNYYGHTTWLFYENETEKVIDRSAKGQYGDTSHNPAYITETFTSDVLDYLQGEMKVDYGINGYEQSLAKNPFNVTRNILLIEDEYLVVYDNLEANASNKYSMIIPLGSANGFTGEKENPKDNWAYGKLYVNQQKQEWYDYETFNPIKSNKTDVINLIWQTQTETNKQEPTSKPVNLIVHLNPKSEINVDVSAMHYGNYGIDYEWAFPYIKVKQQGKEVNYLTTYFPLNKTDDTPLIKQITNKENKNNELATRITRGSTEDLILAGKNQGKNIMGVTTDANIHFSRKVEGKLKYVFLTDASNFAFENKTQFFAKNKGTYLIKYSKESITLENTQDIETEIYLKTNFNPTRALTSVKFDEKPLGYEYDGYTLKTTMPSNGKLTFIAGKTNTLTKPETYIQIPGENTTTTIKPTQTPDTTSTTFQLIDKSTTQITNKPSIPYNAVLFLFIIVLILLLLKKKNKKP